MPVDCTIELRSVKLLNASQFTKVTSDALVKLGFERVVDKKLFAGLSAQRLDSVHI
jgi:hypothetical protein